MGTGSVFVRENGACPHSRSLTEGRCNRIALFLRRDGLPPPNTLAGSMMTARSNSNTPSTAIPSSRNGSAISHTIGHSTKARIASGQQTTSNKTHKRKLIIV